MLEEIRISQLGVIDSSTLELGPGFTVITGETGAGKTMVVTALGLLLGGRADPGAVRRGAKSARVEGLVTVDPDSALAAAVEEAGGTVEEDQVVLARNIAAEGRSRAWVGGASVPAGTLAEIADTLVAVHGQSDQHRLLKTPPQREALDRFGGDRLRKVRERYRALYEDLLRVEKELVDVTTSARERVLEAEQLRFGLQEIESIDPSPGEDLELASEESRLGHADTLRTAAEQAREALSSDAGGADALATTSAARSLLESVRAHDATAAELADRASELSYLLSDLAADVASYASGLETDPARLSAVSERRAALAALTRKYGESIDEVLDWSRRAAERLTGLDGADDRIEHLRAERVRLRTVLGEAAESLTAARSKAARALGDKVSNELTHLAMPHAVVHIEVVQHEISAPPQDQPGGPLRVGERWLRFSQHGTDEIEFQLAANTGTEPRPLHKGASGGELSRVMLALEVVLAETSPVPTFVFDEVDAGVGGKAAIEIGRRLAHLARGAQVLVVTHLPQVAAFADRHVVVQKASDGTVTTSGLNVLDESEREIELSRMLAGLEESDTARAHARELLAAAGAARSGA